MFGNNMKLLRFVNVVQGPSNHEMSSLGLRISSNIRHSGRNLGRDSNIGGGR